MIINCNDSIDWLRELLNRYPPKKTDIQISEDNITVFYFPNPARRMLVARFNKVTKKGTVMCSRRVNIPVDFDRRNK